MRIFITGASGFVGGHTTEALVAAGHEVLAMARSDRSAGAVSAFGATPVRCELGAVSAEHLDGIDAIVHCAAFVEEWGTREQFWRANVDGTTQLLAAAKAAGVHRFIHIGTEAALFDGRELRDVDESCAYPQRQRFFYSESKAEAERRVLAANTPDLQTISLRPRLIWGPRDTSVLPAILRMAATNSWAWLDGGRHETSTTHVANLVHAITLALTRDAGGEAYFIADAERSTIRSFLEQLTATQGVHLPERSMPGALARGAAWTVEGIWRLFRIRRPPPMTLFAISMMSRTITVRTDRAKQALAYTPQMSLEQGLQELRELENLQNLQTS